MNCESTFYLIFGHWLDILKVGIILDLQWSLFYSTDLTNRCILIICFQKSSLVCDKIDYIDLKLIFKFTHTIGGVKLIVV